MRQFFWSLFAKLVSHPFVSAWLIERALKTPYTHIYKDGALYMARYWLFNPYPAHNAIKRKWHFWKWQFPLSIRIHHICQPDRDRDMHDHPWNARTIILSGHYVEERLAHEGVFQGVHCAQVVRHERSKGDTASLRFNEYHRINHISDEGVWTMFITFKYKGTWGYNVNGVKVHWKEYLKTGEVK